MEDRTAAAEFKAIGLQQELKQAEKEIQGLKLQITQLGLNQNSANQQQSEFKLVLAGKDKEIYDLKVQIGKKDKVIMDLTNNLSSERAQKDQLISKVSLLEQEISSGKLNVS